MSLWTYFMNTMSASSFAEENEAVSARTMMEEADKTRLADAEKLTPANLRYAAAALAEEGLWPDAAAMDDEADRILLKEAKIPVWQRTFAAVAFAEESEHDMAGSILANGVLHAANDVQVQDRRLELFVRGYVSMAGAVAFAEEGDREQALRLSSAECDQILVIAKGGHLHERLMNYSLRLAEKAGLELVVLNASGRSRGKKNSNAMPDGLQKLLAEARRRKIPCRHYATGDKPSRTVDAVCAELGKVAFVLTETARESEQSARGDVPVFTMAFLDEAIGEPSAA